MSIIQSSVYILFSIVNTNVKIKSISSCVPENSWLTETYYKKKNWYLYKISDHTYSLRIAEFIEQHLSLGKTESTNIFELVPKLKAKSKFNKFTNEQSINFWKVISYLDLDVVESNLLYLSIQYGTDLNKQDFKKVFDTHFGRHREYSKNTQKDYFNTHWEHY